MDDNAIHNSLVAASIVFVVLLQLLKQRLRPAPRLPPGPLGLPIIGSAHLLVNKLAHRELRALAKRHGPLMLVQLGQIPLVVVTSRELARDFMKTHDANFATRPKLQVGEIVGYEWADILFSPSGDYWRKLRRLCNMEILSPKRIMSFRHIREEEILCRVEEIKSAGTTTPVDLSTMFHAITNSIVARAALGKKPEDSPEFRTAVKAAVGLSSGFNVPDLFPSFTGVLSSITGMKRALVDIHRTIDPILEKIIEERRVNRTEKLKEGVEMVEENLVDVLLNLQAQDNFGFPITQDTIKCVILDMFAGGTGTSGSAMEWAMSELIRNPRVMAKLQGELRTAFPGKATITEGELHSSQPKYLRMVIKEVLRLHPPAPLLVPRETIETCEIEGYTIPAKTRVAINMWAIARDPKYWDAPEEFRPERFEDGSIDFGGSNFEYTPFGSGRRMCPGYNYGLASMELTLAQLVHCFDWSLPSGVSDVDMDEAPGLGVRRKTPLLLCATPYSPN